MREKDYYGAIKGFCLKWNLPEVWNSDRITGANLIYEVIKVINAMIVEQKEVKEMVEDFIKMFDENLDETVKNILIEWKDSGLLEGIINDALFNQKLDKSVFEDYKNSELIKDLELKNDLILLTKDFEMKTYNTDFILELFIMLKSNNSENKEGDPYYYSSPQGSCVIGNNILIAYINYAGLPLNNMGVVREYNIETGIMIRETSVGQIYHANGMDFNPITRKVYISHANTKTVSGSQFNNDLTVLDYDSFNFENVITPSNLPDDRRVKGYSYDKVTGKQYLSDDKGVFEIDNNFEIVSKIDFDPKFFKLTNWGLGQSSSVNNDIIYYLVMGPETVVTFDIKGNLRNLNQLPTIRTYQGFFIGGESQSISFNNNGDYLLTTRYGLEGAYSDQMIVNVFKGNFEVGVVDQGTPYTANVRTSKNIYVDSNSNSPRPKGTSDNPFKSLEFALYYATQNLGGYEINFILSEGRYHLTVINTNGKKVRITGTSKDKTIIEGLRVSNTYLTLNNLTVEKNINYVPVINCSESSLNLKGVIVNGLGKGTGISTESGSTVYSENLTGNVMRNLDMGYRINASMLLASGSSTVFENVTTPYHKTGTGFIPLIEI